MKGYLSAAWRIVSSRPAVAIAALVGGVLLAGECRLFRAETAAERRPIRVEPTKRAEKWDVVRVPADLAVPQVPAGDLDRIRREYRRPDLRPAASGAPGSPATPSGPVVLGEDKLPALPRGGTVLKTLEADGSIGLTVLPKPPSFVEAKLRLRPYLDIAKEAWGGGTSPGDDLPVEKIAVGLQLELVRVGRFDAQPYVEAGRLFGRDTVLFGARVYFGRD